METSGALRRRIVLACVILAAVLCAVYALVVVVSLRVIEDRLLNDRLAEAADQLIAHHLRGFRSEIPGGPHVYEGDAIPADLRNFMPGTHETSVDGRVLHVVVRDQGGRRFAVVDDESEFEQLEADVWVAAAGAFMLCMGLAFVLGRTTAARVIQPVVQLAAAVRDNRLDRGTPLLQAKDEVGVLARALATYQQEMDRFLARERLFTGDVSHELRTPLTVIQGAAELLAFLAADRPDLLPVVQRIHRTTVETAGRVSALLLLSRHPEGLASPEVQLAPVIEREIERCRPLLQDKPVDLRFEVSHAAAVAGQPELIAVAIGNLVRNACQFTERGSVRVVLERDCIRVSDSGPGVPAAMRSQIFGRFVRADSGVVGTGLGLGIVQRICEHLRWSVQLLPSEMGGSCFVLAWTSTTEP